MLKRILDFGYSKATTIVSAIIFVDKFKNCSILSLNLREKYDSLLEMFDLKIEAIKRVCILFLSLYVCVRVCHIVYYNSILCT